MLVLSRRQGERIQIGEVVVVTIVKAGRNRIRLGIEAPDDVAIARQELVLRKAERPEQTLDHTGRLQERLKSGRGSE